VSLSKRVSKNNSYVVTKQWLKNENFINNGNSKQVMARKKVAILTCGGTPAMSLSPTLKVKYNGPELINKFPSLETLADLEVDEVFSKDSSEMKPQDWQIITERAHHYVMRDDISGIVVIHGTDTMEDTLMAVALMIRNLNKPIVFTGTQVPAEKDMHHAEKLFYDSVLTAANSGINDVVLCFSGDETSTFTNLYRASTAFKFSTHKYDAFRSWDGPIVAIVDGKFKFSPQYNSHQYKITKPTEFPLLKTNLELNVGYANVVIGTDYGEQIISNIITPREEVIPQDKVTPRNRGYILGTNTDGYDLLSHTRDAEAKATLKALEAGLVVGVVSNDGSPVILANGIDIQLREKGAVPLGRMNFRKALVKLSWVLGQTQDNEEARRMLAYDYCGEIPPNSFDTEMKPFHHTD